MRSKIKIPPVGTLSDAKKLFTGKGWEPKPVFGSPSHILARNLLRTEDDIRTLLDNLGWALLCPSCKGEMVFPCKFHPEGHACESCGGTGIEVYREEHYRDMCLVQMLSALAKFQNRIEELKEQNTMPNRPPQWWIELTAHTGQMTFDFTGN